MNMDAPSNFSMQEVLRKQPKYGQLIILKLRQLFLPQSGAEMNNQLTEGDSTVSDSYAQIMEQESNSRLFEALLKKRFRQGKQLVDLYQQRRDYFDWIMKNRLADLDLYNLEKAYEFSPEGAKYAISMGMETHQIRAVAYNFGLAPDLARLFVAHQLPQINQVWEENHVAIYRLVFAKHSDWVAPLLRTGCDAEELLQLIQQLKSFEDPDTLLTYAEYYQLNKKTLNAFMELAARHYRVVQVLAKTRTPLSCIIEATRFEENRPMYAQYSLITHAHRIEHYESMLTRAIENGAQMSFRLRSKEENTIEGIGIQAYSPDGFGSAFEPGLPFISTQLNGVQGYGGLCWVGQTDILLRKPHLRFWNLGRVRSFDGGELSVSTRRGRLIDLNSKVRKLLIAMEKGEDISDNDVRRAIADYRGIKYPESEQAFIKIEDNQLTQESILETEKGAQDMLEQESDQGLDLHSVYVVCLAPADVIDRLKSEIQSSNITEPEKALLLSQLVPYEGLLSEAVDKFREDKEVYIRAVQRNQIALGKETSLTQIESTLSVREALSRASIVESEPRYYGLSNAPLMMEPYELFTEEISMVMQNQLAQTAEWKFLNSLPSEAGGVVHPVLNKIVRDAVRPFIDEHTAIRFASGPTHKKIWASIVEIGIDIEKPIVDLSSERQRYLTEVFEIPLEIIQKNNSVLNAWINRMFPTLIS